MRHLSTALSSGFMLLVLGCGSGGGAGGDSSGTGAGGGDGGAGGEPAGAGGSGGDVSSGTAQGGFAPTGGSGAGGASGCTGDQDCDPGTICDPSSGACVAGCSDLSPCSDGLTCCGSTCVDVQTDFDHCGSCPNACDDLPNLASSCESGICTVGACDAGFFNCDGDASNGCESAQSCTCAPGSTQSCYTGPANTQNVGLCAGGSQTCGPTGQGWGPCIGEVLPDNEICSNGIDEDCSGVADDVPDLDGDGWTVCNGDCCDSMAQGCTEPAKVNPGAYEALGNNLDDDCDPSTSDSSPQPTACSAGNNFGAVTGTQLAQAMDICQTTTANPPLMQKKWGLISAALVQPNGTAVAPQNIQLAVMTNFGVNNPQLNTTMAAISSGTARDPGDNSGYIVPNGTGYTGGANNGTWPPSAPGVGAVNDGVNLRMSLRAPTNAQSFSFKFKFFSAEYPEWVSSQFNDTFLALLTSMAVGIPADKNISFDAMGGRVDVNNGFFEVCSGCASGDATLAATGYTTPQVPVGDAGATNWLTTSSPIVGGETFTIEYMIFDVADHSWDSLVLLDSFVWSVNPSAVGTVED